MLRLYFLGGEDLQERNSKEIDQRAFQEAGGSPSVLVFPWTSKTTAREDKYRRLMVEYFKELGARAVRFVEVSLPYTEMVQLVEQSDLIYLPGGDTRLLLDRMRNTGAAHLIQVYDKIILGNSAGALALCKEFVLRPEGEGGGLSIGSGLGLVDFSVAVHYEPSQDQELEGLSKDRHIFAIPEGGALVFDECNICLFGEVVMFQDGSKA